MPLAPGAKLGPYEILAPLGAGGMGEVYRARDTRLERTVAIKILPAQLSADPIRKQRFEREAKTISSLNHPHICVLHDVGHQDGMDYLVMECVEGETLAKRLEKGSLPLEQVLKYGAQIADALDKAHGNGIVHRDLKPGNIMLTKSGAKLLDFGLAKPVASEAAAVTLMTTPTGARALTAEGVIVGTFQYMSPEQLEGKEADARTDIFAFGAVLYEMGTGTKAFDGKTQASIIAAILEREPPPMSSLQPMAPAALDRVVKTCLAKDPDERWQTAHDVKLQLQWIAEGGSQALAAARTQTPGIARRGLWLTAGITFAGVVTAIVLSYLFRPVAPARKVMRLSILPPEKSSFLESANSWGAVAVSPDGSRIVVGLTGQTGRPILYVRPFDALTGQVLAGTEGGAFPFWSPDGRSIGFFADGQLKTIDATGGPVHALAPAPDGRGGTWNRDGIIVFTPSTFEGLFRVATSGGAAVAVTKVNTGRHQETHRWPQFLPDERHFLYLSRTNDIDSSEIYVGSIDGGEPVSVVHAVGNPAYAAPGWLFYPQGNTLVAQRFDATHFQVSGEPITIADQVSANGNVQHSTFSVSANGVLAYMRAAGGGLSELIWTDRNGNVLGKVGEPGHYFSPRLSTDGRRLAVEIVDPRTYSNSDIWVYDFARNSRTRLTFSRSNEHNRMPVWSPDASRIVFSSDRSGHYQVYEKTVSGTAAEYVLYPSDGHRYATTWSRDGQFVAGFEENPEHGGLRMLLLPRPPADKALSITPAGTHITRFSLPQVSPNGKWIAYASWESGRAEIYVSAFPSGAGKWQVSVNGGFDPVWRPDGKELFYVALGDTLMAAEISEEGEAPAVGNVQPLFQTHRVASPNWVYGISPDGKRFLINSVLQPLVPEPITLVVNWDGELNTK
jgi:serine/threonine protein kinase